MKSLIKKPQKSTSSDARTKPPELPKQKPVAQCCAKVSKAVAGCHD